MKIEAVIDSQYRKLITRHSRFHRNSGIKVHAGLDGINIAANSLLTIAAGGISCVNLHGIPAKKKNTPWKLYNSRKEIEDALHTFSITITMPQADGITSGTAVIYKGIIVGKVKEVRFAKDMQSVIAHATIEKKARKLFTKGTMIWAQQPQVGLEGIEHAKALVLGPNLAILPGNGAVTNDFLLLKKPPYAEIANKSGMGVVLEAAHLGSITIGSPVYYRQVQVGQVTGYELSPSFQTVEIFISIKQRFRPLIRMNTRFWNASGMRINGGLFSGVTLSTESIAAIIRGGIALATPNSEDKKVSPPAKAGERFTLYEKPEESWLDWQPDIKIFEKEDAAAYLRSKK